MPPETKISQAGHLKSLGNQNTEYQYSGADASLLEMFPNPMRSKELHRYPAPEGHVRIEAPEFTSLCPKTGQPDFATIVVDYIPGAYCVESKSFKLYLGSFRNVGEFHESCVYKIFSDLMKLLEPVAMTVQGQFTPRGGISFWPTMSYDSRAITSEIEISGEDRGPLLDA